MLCIDQNDNVNGRKKQSFWVKNGEKLTSTSEQIFILTKKSTSHVSALKASPNGVARRPKISICVYLQILLPGFFYTSFNQCDVVVIFAY